MTAVSSQQSVVSKDIGDKSMMKTILVWLLATAILISAPAAQAQQPGKILRIGFLDASTASSSAAQWQAFRQELSKLGWIEGKSIALEFRFAELKSERLPSLRRTWLV